MTHHQDELQDAGNGETPVSSSLPLLAIISIIYGHHHQDELQGNRNGQTPMSSSSPSLTIIDLLRPPSK